ncbi:MAG TPA: sulfatase-like hydrolase/transferase [Gammaproteobacteria bacterium]
MSRLRAALPILAALFLLNAALSFHNVWPTVFITWRYEISVEIALLVLALALYRERFPPLGRAALRALAAALFVLALGRYAEVTAPALYGRPVNLYWDAQHIPKVIAMLATAAAPWLVALGALALVALLAGLFLALRWALARVDRALADRRWRRGLAAGAAGLVALYALSQARVVQRGPTFSLPVSVTYLRQARFVAEAYLEQRTGRTLPPGERAAAMLASADLARLRGADVLLIFIESYGAAVYDSPEIAHVVQEGRDRLGAAVTDTGRQIVSAFVTSPTFGGSSWLAHVTLLTGTTVADNGSYSLMLTQKRATLPRRFAAAGYRTVAVMPGLKAAWPEGAFYGFDRIYGEADLDYRGPEFGWWRIPDQYSLARLDALELAGTERAPVLVFFPTISTHTPFGPTPPYQPDWERVLSDTPFDAEAVAESLADLPEWTNLQPSYARSVAYSLTYLAGYLRARADRDPVIVVLGDHQPQASVTGPNARWDVPVHVITRNDAIVDVLLEAGFVARLTPVDEPIGRMEDLTAVLLRAFSSPGALPAPLPHGASE